VDALIMARRAAKPFYEGHSGSGRRLCREVKHAPGSGPWIARVLVAAPCDWQPRWAYTLS
jgi:hypothetical protein